MGEDQQRRLESANQFIREIGVRGRRFFYDEKRERYARLELDDRGRAWFVDDYTDERIYTHLRDRKWRGFSHGGALKSLIELLCDHVTKGAHLNPRYFDIRPSLFGSGHPWGYPHEACLELKAAGIRLGIILEQEGSGDE